MMRRIVAASVLAGLALAVPALPTEPTVQVQIVTDEADAALVYTVGWKMAAMVERARGRDALLKTLCDPRTLLAASNEVAAAHPRSDGGALATWSPDFLAALQGAATP